MAELTVFYDGLCPLCSKEINHLRKLDKPGLLKLEDINQDDFESRYPHISKTEANAVLLSQLPDGTLLRGLDTTHAAWSLVGKGYLTAWLRWPIIRWFADKAYTFFARRRHTISRLLTGQERCEACEINSDR